MLLFDPLYFIILAPGILLALWAQYRVSSAFSQASRIPAASGVSGAQAAQYLLDAAGVEGVQIEPTQGYLSDHYDPSERTLRLSPGVYRERSLAALGVAAHEAGHAIQHAQHYAPLIFRNILVPVATFGSQAAWLIIFLGFALTYGRLLPLDIGRWVVYTGVILFSTVVFFQVVNLPVEFDASRRARIALQEAGLVSPEEDRVVGRVLNAAALTYVAGTLTAILTLLYYVIRASALGGRDES
jgi:Zn-dependent membrane protease YugP